MGRAWPAKFHQRNRAAGGLVDVTKPSGFVTHATASNDVLQLPLHKAQNRFESAQAGTKYRKYTLLASSKVLWRSAAFSGSHVARNRAFPLVSREYGRGARAFPKVLAPCQTQACISREQQKWDKESLTLAEILIEGLSVKT